LRCFNSYPPRTAPKKLRRPACDFFARNVALDLQMLADMLDNKQPNCDMGGGAE
jgi:hypothetical protein